MNLNQLNVFHVAAAEKSFTRTAEKLHLTQPGISKHIKNLEDFFGVPLFDRAGKRVILTRAGEILYEATQKVFCIMDETKQKIDDLESLTTGSLRIGASITLGIYVLLPVVKEFRDRYPKIEVGLDVCLSRQVVEKVLSHGLDIGFIGAAVEDKRLVVKEFIDDELILIFPARHRWGDRKVVDIHELETETFLRSQSGSGTRTVLDERFKELGISLKAMELGHTESVKRAVEAGLGVSIVSRAVAARELTTGQLKTARLKGFNLARKFYYTYRRDSYVSKAVSAFLSIVTEGKNHPTTVPRRRPRSSASRAGY